MSDMDMDRPPSPSLTKTPMLPFSPMESPIRDERIGISTDLQPPSPLDSATNAIYFEEIGPSVYRHEADAKTNTDPFVAPGVSDEIVSSRASDQIVVPRASDPIVAPRISDMSVAPRASDPIAAPSAPDLIIANGAPDPSESEDDDMDGFDGFETGDMVWGKVKSHPWWPGHIFNEAFASSTVRRTRRDDSVLVAFFGDSSYGWFDPAELVPYAPTFLEKSKQTTLRSFVRAVEESVDEASRRAALGLSCRCRNPFNFRTTNVPNYFTVDVVGYERDGIYSERQIMDARDKFKPEDTLNFLKQVVVTPRGSEVKNVDWYQNVAVALALRRARFEEFDETYAQAFGQEPVRPPMNEMGVPQQAENFARRVAPFQGSLKIAEQLDKSLTRQHREKKKIKKDNFVLRRRDDHASSSVALPDGAATSYSPSSPQQHHHLGLVPVKLSPEPAPVTSDYLFQRRAPEPDHANLPPQPLHHPVPQPPSEKRVLLPIPAAASTGAAAAAEQTLKKAKKHAREDEGSDNPEMREDKKKKKKKKKKNKKKKVEYVDDRAAMTVVAVVPPLPVSTPSNVVHNLGPLNHLQIPDLLADLWALALDPFHGADRNAPDNTRRMLLYFRSLVYTKSRLVDTPGESSTQVVLKRTKPKLKEKKLKDVAAIAPPPSATAVASSAAVAATPKHGNLINRVDDPSISGRKRPPSDRQEEKSVKRTKKLTELKALAAGKKPNHQKEKGNNNGASCSKTTLLSAAEPATKKPEKQELLLPLPPRRESPTYLVMKFPCGSTLPSVASLKARFARFGPLDVNSIRVFWKSYTCKVLFKFKVDAISAYTHAKRNDYYGQVRVDYSLRELELDIPAPPSEQPALQPGPGNENASSVIKLKSILKKPGEEAGKENQRVKFMFADDGKKAVSLSPPSAPALPDSPPQPVPSLRPTSFSPHQHRQALAPPAPAPHAVENRAQHVGFSSSQNWGRMDEVDVAHQILKLLLKCDDVVTRLKTLPGFVPFRAL